MSDSPSNPRRPLLERGTLRERMAQVTTAALESGALLSIPTSGERVTDGAVTFLVRVVESLSRKDAERRRQAGLGDPTAGAAAWGRADSKAGATGPAGVAPRDPFLPYEEALYVGDLTDTHVVVLNKFNVVPEHLLVVTRAFEHQDRLLGAADFEALLACLAEVDGLGFYNGGVIAGASQPHKHLQVVPLPFESEGPEVPVAPLLDGAGTQAGPTRVKGLQFRHAFLTSPPGLPEDPARSAIELLGRYRALLEAIDRPAIPGAHGETCAPYNLLVTRRWMLAVPRREECFEGISLNSLAFAGALLVRDRRQLERLRAAGPMRALVHAAGPA